jgi:hypothetical protein
MLVVLQPNPSCNDRCDDSDSATSSASALASAFASAIFAAFFSALLVADSRWSRSVKGVRGARLCPPELATVASDTAAGAMLSVGGGGRPNVLPALSALSKAVGDAAAAMEPFASSMLVNPPEVTAPTAALVVLASAASAEAALAS